MGLKEGSVFYMHINMSNYMPGVYEHVVLPHLPANATYVRFETTVTLFSFVSPAWFSSFWLFKSVKNSSAEVRWGFWNGFIPLRVQSTPIAASHPSRPSALGLHELNSYFVLLCQPSTETRWGSTRWTRRT
jgi:hypothetical protein